MSVPRADKGDKTTLLLERPRDPSLAPSQSGFLVFLLFQDLRHPIANYVPRTVSALHESMRLEGWLRFFSFGKLAASKNNLQRIRHVGAA